MIYKIFQIIVPLIPVILTGIITFLITRYTQEKNIPLDKLEIAYNRVYYPIYLLMRNKKYSNADHQQIKNKMNTILKKYDKYISPSTRNSFLTYFNILDTDHKHQFFSFTNLTNNIFYYNSKIRRQLGYPQAGVIEIYKYLSNKEKYIINFFICLFLIYLSIIVFIIYNLNLLVLILVFCLFILLYIPCQYVFEYIHMKISIKKS